MNEKSSIPAFIFTVVIVLITFILMSPKINLVLKGSMKNAKFFKCESKLNTRTLTLNGERYTSYGQIAKTPEGEIAYGLPFLLDKKVCEQRVGEIVSVFIHPNDPKKSQINTFFNFWLFPYLGFYIITLLVNGLMRGRINMKLNVLLLVIGVGLGVMEFYT